MLADEADNRGADIMSEINDGKQPTPPTGEAPPKSNRQTWSIVILVGLVIVLGAVAVWSARRERVSTEDANRDGRADSWLYYDAAGHPTKFEKDRNFDGKVDWRDIEVWDAAKSKARVVRTEVDSDFNGTFDTVITYNADGQMVKLERDANNDGRADIVSTYDQPNKPPKIMVDRNGTGQFEPATPAPAAAPRPATAAPAPPAKKKP
jgi:hypothetical protein